MNTNILTYRVIIKKDGKFYHASVPSLPGCHSQGKTIDETKKNARKAIESYLKVVQKNNLPITKEDGLESIETFDLKKIFSKQTRCSYA